MLETYKKSLLLAVDAINREGFPKDEFIKSITDATTTQELDDLSMALESWIYGY